MGEFKDKDVHLVASWEPGKGFLAGSYTISNSGEARLVVFDVLFNTARNGTRSVDPALAWRWLTSEGVYQVVKQVPPIPEGVLVEMPVMPYARVLEPGTSLTGTAMLPLPLDYAWAYPDFGQRAPQNTEVRQLELILGYAVVDEAIQAKPFGAPELGYYAVRFAWASARQRLIATERVDVAFPMREPGLTNP